MDSVIDTTQKLLKGCKASDVEIEARIRKQLVNEVSHARLLDGLNIEWEREVYVEKRRISKSNRKCAYRQRSAQNTHPVTICKSSIAKEDINDHWCALHVSVETHVPSMSHSLAGVAPVSVTRYRGDMDGHYIDAIYDDKQGYRVEVEVQSADAFNPDSTLRIIRLVCAALQGSRNFTGYYDWLTVLHVANTRFGEFCFGLGNYQKPRTMTMSALSDIASDVGSWVVTPKVDGERRFLIALESRVFSISSTNDVRLEGAAPDNRGVFFLDCEYTKDNDTFHVFDAVVANGEYLGKGGNLSERLDTAGTLCSAMSGDIRTRTTVKGHHSFSSFDKLCELYDSFKGNSGYNIDGMIFVNTNMGYMQQVPKWKEHSTVDLMVTDGVLTTCDGYIVDTRVSSPVVNGVWEFRYDKDNKELIPERPRPDKIQANSNNIVRTNMFFAVPGSIFSGLGCYLMRKYHNRVKVSLIKGANDNKAVILDIGTGQGGDVTKWQRASAVYCVEPSESSTYDMIRRHGNMQNVKIINVYLKDLDHAAIDKKVDIFTAFFCMNQFQDADWDALKKLVIAKGSSKCRLLAIAMTSPKTHRGGCFDIRMTSVDGYNISIHNTRIQDIDERIVEPATLTGMMRRCKMGLVKHERLDGDDFMTREERKLSSMYEMFVYKKRATLSKQPSDK
jgi:hypothetical protein